MIIVTPPTRSLGPRYSWQVTKTCHVFTVLHKKGKFLASWYFIVGKSSVFHDYYQHFPPQCMIKIPPIPYAILILELVTFIVQWNAICDEKKQK